MSKVLTEVFGAENLPVLEKLASEALEAANQQEPAEQETQTEEPSALDLLALNRADQMLKVANDVLESEAAAEGAPEGATEEEALDDAITLRALEKIAEAGYDPDAVIEVLNRAQQQ